MVAAGLAAVPLPALAAAPDPGDGLIAYAAAGGGAIEGMTAWTAAPTKTH
jgi:hypothetical protein